jgi:hypothetical protein
MTNKKIAAMLNRETIKHQTATQINDLLDAAAKQLGLKGDEIAEFRGEILELVNEDDE